MEGKQSLQQQRAKFALEKVKAAADDNRLNRKEYQGCASGLPAMICINGLGQAAAFYRSKNGMHKMLYELLSEWLRQTGQPYGGHDDLLAGITQGDLHHYRAAQAEALLLLEWVKKFAQAFMEEEKS